MENQKFHADVNLMFESFLKKEDSPIILIKNKKTGEVLKKMKYEKVMFDSNLNIFKILKNGQIEKVDNPEFEAVVLKR